MELFFLLDPSMELTFCEIFLATAFYGSSQMVLLWPSFPVLIESVYNAFSTSDYTTTDTFKSSVESLGLISPPPPFGQSPLVFWSKILLESSSSPVSIRILLLYFSFVSSEGDM